MTPHSSLWATNKYSTFSPKHQHNDLRLVCSATYRRVVWRPAVGLPHDQRYIMYKIWGRSLA